MFLLKRIWVNKLTGGGNSSFVDVDKAFCAIAADDGLQVLVCQFQELFVSLDPGLLSFTSVNRDNGLGSLLKFPLEAGGQSACVCECLLLRLELKFEFLAIRFHS